MVRVCFVCLGNICRSPTAEGIMLAMVRDGGLQDSIAVDSAGTSSYHVGEGADPRSAQTATRFGVTLVSRSRQFVVSDFDDFDYIVAMDRANLRALTQLSRTAEDRARLSLLLSHDDTADDPDVPDPYYGGRDGFADVFAICERGCAGLLATIRAQRGL